MASSGLVYDDLVGPQTTWMAVGAIATPQSPSIEVHAPRLWNGNIICSPTVKEFPGKLQERMFATEDGAELEQKQGLEIKLDEKTHVTTDGSKSGLQLKLADLCLAQNGVSTECPITALNNCHEGSEVTGIVLQSEGDNQTMELQSSTRSSLINSSKMRGKLHDAPVISGRSSQLAKSDNQKACEAQPRGEVKNDEVVSQEVDKLCKDSEGRSQTASPPQPKKKTVKVVKTIKVVRTVRVPKSQLPLEDSEKRSAQTDNRKTTKEVKQSKSVVGSRKESRTDPSKDINPTKESERLDHHSIRPKRSLTSSSPSRVMKQKIISGGGQSAYDNIVTQVQSVTGMDQGKSDTNTDLHPSKVSERPDHHSVEPKRSLTSRSSPHRVIKRKAISNAGQSAYDNTVVESDGSGTGMGRSKTDATKELHPNKEYEKPDVRPKRSLTSHSSSHRVTKRKVISDGGQSTLDNTTVVAQTQRDARTDLEMDQSKTDSTKELHLSKESERPDHHSVDPKRSLTSSSGPRRVKKRKVISDNDNTTVVARTQSVIGIDSKTKTSKEVHPSKESERPDHHSVELERNLTSRSSPHRVIKQKVISDGGRSAYDSTVAAQTQSGTGIARKISRRKQSGTKPVTLANDRGTDLVRPSSGKKTDVMRKSSELSVHKSSSSGTRLLSGVQSSDTAAGKPQVQQESAEMTGSRSKKLSVSHVTQDGHSSRKVSSGVTPKEPTTIRQLTKRQSFETKDGIKDESSLSNTSRPTSTVSVHTGIAAARKVSRSRQTEGSVQIEGAALQSADADTQTAKSKSLPRMTAKRSRVRLSENQMKDTALQSADAETQTAKSPVVKSSPRMTMKRPSTSGSKRLIQKRKSETELGKGVNRNEVDRVAVKKTSCSPHKDPLRKQKSSDSLPASQKPLAGTRTSPVRSVIDTKKTTAARVDSGLRVKSKASGSASSEVVSSALHPSDVNKLCAADSCIASSAQLPAGLKTGHRVKSAGVPLTLQDKSEPPGTVGTVEDSTCAVSDRRLSVQSMQLSDSDLQHLRDSAQSPLLSSFGHDRASIKPRFRKRPSINPVKQLQSRKDVESELTGSSKNDVDERPRSAPNKTVATGVPENGKIMLHDAAKAGLASKEDFKAIVLRKTKKHPDGTAISEENDEVNGLAQPSLVVVQIKGRRRIQVHLVEPLVKSLNSGDVFIVFTSTQLYQWVGSEANAFEKAKGTDLATRIIQKKDMGCRAKSVTAIEQKSDFIGPRLRGMLKLIGGDGSSRVKTSSEAANDEDHEKKCIERVMIYSVKDGEDALVPRRELCGKAPKFAMLNTNEVFVFDFYTELYVWIGRVSLGNLRRQGVTLAKRLFDRGYVRLQPEVSNGPAHPTRRRSSVTRRSKDGHSRRPSWALFSKIAEGAEMFLFKEKFADWPEPGRIIKMKGHVSSGEVLPAPPRAELVPCDVEMMRRPVIPPRDCILEGDNLGRGQGISSTTEKEGIAVGTTSVKVYHIKEYDYTEVDADEIGVFYSAEGYVIRWEYRVYKEPPKQIVRRGQRRRHSTIHEFGGRQRCCYFFWQGKECTVTEKGAAAVITVELDEEKGPQIRVPQSKEPPVFLQVFGGGIVVLAGKRPTVGKKSFDASRNRLFSIRGETANEALLEEVATPSAQSLRSQGCFVVISALAQSVFVWEGCMASNSTHAVAMAASKKLMNKLHCAGVGENYGLVEVEEGEEKMRFWRSIGGKYDYYSLLNENVSDDKSLRLFHLSSTTGKFSAEEVLCPSRAQDGSCVFPFLQSDIYSVQQPAVFLLEAYRTVYLWLGWWPGESEGESPPPITGTALSRWLQDKQLGMKTAETYARAISRRCPAYVVVAGFEPDQFRNIFPSWHPQKGIENHAAHVCKDSSSLLLVEDELKKFYKKFSIEELRLRPLPDNVDPIRLETYLTDADFQMVFKLTRDQFSQLPKWKQMDAKKAAGLF